ncbi:leucine-rich repeat protein [uncultured Methanolobus sp.]|uniref:leucine-rich repeat protein n=1 Tax=uncultured Methanolobus sp. TaxID=218300 RepID=UPI002AAB547C|nr:leucine-rich repeat protein [uncultured Methanolobus sp.]
MNKSGMRVVLTTLILLLSIATLVIPATAAGEATITRTITPAAVSAGDTYNVTLTISYNANADFVAIHEDLPEDWMLTEVNSGRYGWSISQKDYVFMNTGSMNLAGVTETVTYNVTVPEETAAGTYSYGSGYVAGNDGEWQVDTTGDSELTVLSTSGAPVADFSADVTSGTSMLTVQFSDLSTNAESWSWDFDNDGKEDSTEQNPQYIFIKPGTYTVSLNVSNFAGSNIKTVTDCIEVIAPTTTNNVYEIYPDYPYKTLYNLMNYVIQPEDTVFFHAGTYDVYYVLQDSDIDVTNVTWRGEGADLVTLYLYGTCDVNLEASGCVLENMTLLNSRGLNFYNEPINTAVRNCIFEGMINYVWISGADSCVFENNIFSNGTSEYGPFLIEGNNHIVRNNTFINNSGPAIFLYSTADGNIITNNQINSNDQAFGFMESSGVNTVYLNNIEVNGATSIIYDTAYPSVNWNTTEAVSYTYNGATYTGILGNYWGSSYTGTDADGDGIGDTPYVLPDGCGTDYAPLMSPFKNYVISEGGVTGPVADFTYIVNDTSVVITGYVGSSGNVIIPSTIEGLPVTCVGASAFKSNTNITSVTMPDSVTSIGDEAFEDCTNLTSVNIGSGVTSIGNYAFHSCTSLSSVSMPDSVTSIGASAFRGCSSLSSVTIPDSVTSIGNYAFRDCTFLSSVSIPDSVTSIGASAFRGCTNLTSVTIGSGITDLGDSMFRECTSLSSVTIPDSVTSIGKYVFHDCTSLSSVTIPDSVTSIGKYVFRDCTSLSSVTIPDSVTSIGTSAFQGCTNLTSVTIPDSVTSIGKYVFHDCTSLPAISVDANNTVYTSVGGILYDKNVTTLIMCPVGRCGSVVIPEGVTAIEDNAFRSCSSLSSVSIPDSVTRIGRYAFSGCISLDEMVFEGNAPSVGSSWIRDCVNLVVYYQPGATGFTTPTWEGVPCYPILPLLSFVPVDAEVIDGQTTEIVISVDSLPGGLSGYELTVDIDDPAIAEIVDVSYPDWVSISDNSSLPNGSIYIKAVDGNNAIEAGAEDVVLATLTVAGKDMGTTNFTLGVKRLDDDTGAQINATLEIGTLEVTRTPIPGQTASPRDLDGDGLYEDLTGDGVCSFVDVEVLFYQMDWIEANMPSKVDYNGNGRVDFDDVVALFDMV